MTFQAGNKEITTKLSQLIAKEKAKAAEIMASKTEKKRPAEEATKSTGEGSSKKQKRGGSKRKR
jgi:hypothetical protein